MKKTVPASCFLLLLFLFFHTASGQGKVNLSITVINTVNQKMSGAAVMLEETGSGKQLETKTDVSGIAKLELTEGKEWQLHINGTKMRNIIQVPEQAVLVRTITVTYNPDLDKRMNGQTTERSGLANEDQKYTAKDHPPHGRAMVKVLLQSRQGLGQANKKVRVVNITDKKSYTALSGRGGVTVFMLEPGKKYDVDVEDNLNVSFFDVGSRPGVILSITCFFDPPAIEEQRSGDTIVQKIKAEKAATGRAFYTLSVKQHGTGAAANEAVYLAEIHGRDIYLAYTDMNGEARFLLPVGKKYMIHFDFEKDVDVIDLSHARGYVSGNMRLHYRPNPKLAHPELFIPRKEELFLIDFENFLTKNFPRPKAPEKVGLFLKWGNKINANSKEALLEIGYTAESGGAHIPSNLCFVIDNSGSMAGYYRIERLKEALVELFKTLPENDIASLITFESATEVLMTPQKVGPNRQRFIDAIHAIQPKGGTDMKEALLKGHEFVSTHFIKHGNNRVILLSDGYDNNPPEELVNIRRQYVATIECTAIGVGSDYNYALLKQLTGNEKGTLLFVGESDQFLKVFTSDMMLMLRPVATDVSMEIEYRKKLVFKHLYGHAPLSGKGNPVVYQVASLYAGANRVALAKFDLIHPDKDIEQEPVIVRIRYTDTETGKETLREERIFPEWEPYTGKAEALIEGELKKMYAVAEINRALKLMSEFYSAGENEKARTVLEETLVSMKKIYPGAKDKDLEELFASMEQYLEAFRNLAVKESLEQKKKKPRP
jgi:hypothetical protein